ncbi:hypothetical protein CPC08DRAFT_755843 [Agrocybe pediades]|nr:hypothetical protein CPC08DRAFT_755843 [Agrocybe pediades]
MGYDAVALRTAEENVQLTEKYASSSSPLDRNFYRMSHLCLRLFFNGEFTQARQLILEVRSFYEWHAQSRNAWFINLARALRAEGILECASDRHMEGAAARTRLNELQQRLRATFPGLADQVDVGLNYERNYPAWKRLRVKYPLTCSHWVEDGATSTATIVRAKEEGAIEDSQAMESKKLEIKRQIKVTGWTNGIGIAEIETVDSNKKEQRGRALHRTMKIHVLGIEAVHELETLFAELPQLDSKRI